MITSTLRRHSTITDAADFDARRQRMMQRLLPLLEKQPGFISHELRLESAGAQVETTQWQTMDDCRSYLRNGAAAMAATILDAHFPTAPFPNGTWVRENIEA